ncbi:hypothetical protein [Tenggerimyces flavus]|uniref:Uncharacterized protein n=1 Tax=Tenggerimyces flavus TaxID=1708749 RepID=A0ABV7YCE8_9ACTN|nr:hypothetical protein [Tenggerimyces flavus]MBM7783677.1 hypothetical protein [Tenggerimyces flavus]
MVNSLYLQLANRGEDVPIQLVPGTKGVETLTVRVENRRQVFVEAEIDQACYQELFRLIKPKVSRQDLILEFIPTAKGRGGNAAVLELVNCLRQSGPYKVQGLIDRDNNDAAPPAGVTRLPERYAVENIVYDPLAVGLLLLREGIASTSEIDLSDQTTYRNNEPEQMPLVVAYVSQRLNFSDDTSCQMLYSGGISIACHPEYFKCKDTKLLTESSRPFRRLTDGGDKATRSWLQR